MGWSIKKRILFDLFVTPWTVITGFGGIGWLLLSEILGPQAALIGFFSGMFCLGLIATNVLLNFNSISEKVLQKMRNEAIAEKNQRLDLLDEKLCRDKDPRDQESLRDLRELYDSFMEDLYKKQLAFTVPQQMLDQINELFEAIVAQLERQFLIWDSYRKISGPAKKQLKEQREKIILEVQASIGNFASAIEDIRALKLRANTSELQEIQQRFNSQLNVAKRVNQVLEEVESSDDMSRFDEYAKPVQDKKVS